MATHVDPSDFMMMLDVKRHWQSITLYSLVIDETCLCFVEVLISHPLEVHRLLAVPGTCACSRSSRIFFHHQASSAPVENDSWVSFGGIEGLVTSRIPFVLFAGRRWFENRL